MAEIKVPMFVDTESPPLCNEARIQRGQIVIGAQGAMQLRGHGTVRGLDTAHLAILPSHLTTGASTYGQTGPRNTSGLRR